MMELSIIQSVMMDAPPVAPLERLFLAANQWAEACGKSRSHLARLVVNDSGFFSRIDGGKTSPTLTTLTKFAQFFADAGNWPDGRVPAEAVEFAHVNGVSVEAGEVATGQARDLSGYATTALTGGDYLTRGGR